jgi:His/Glu/Gln/Arg/opine family amino acid ABC transporter permease subunit
LDWLSQIGQWFVSAWNWIADSVYKSIVADNRYVFYLTGLGNTLLISLMAVVIGITLGVLIAVVVNAAKANPRLNWAKKICSLYVTVIRGTPVVLQLMIIYYIIFRSVQIPQIVVGGLAFGLNSAAYISEIIRSGIESIDRGQMEAARSLGLSRGKAMRLIILPQAVKNILPALGNEFVTLVKETSVAGYIGLRDLTKASDIVASRTYDYFVPLILAACVYLVIVLGLTKLVRMFERRLAQSDYR